MSAPRDPANRPDIEFWDDIDEENDGLLDCPKCNRAYDEIDQDYQICSKCGWDVGAQQYRTPREPGVDDYMSGDADILTGQWV